MGKYEQNITKYARGLGAEERELKARNPKAYGQIGVLRPIYNILINSVNELNINKNELVTAVNQGEASDYIREHKEYIRNQVIRNTKKLSGQMYRKFDKLLKLIDKYEKTIEQQEKKLNEQKKQIGGLEKRIQKDAEVIKKAKSLIRKTDRLEAFVKAIREYDTPCNELMPSNKDMRYLR